MASPPVDVIVPIYNAAADAERCVASVMRHTHSPFRLILINDGSTDAAVSRLLDGLRGADPRLVVVDRRENLGFVRTVNEGLALSADADVVLLNSDTVVSRGWLDKMTAAARSRPDVATVTPLTNNGTLCSVPVPFEANEIPPGYDIDRFADLIETESLRLRPEAPTGVGFCMLVTRRALTAVGGFDAGAFGRGYGEENDFCQRAIRAGLVNLIADDTFVYHKGRASFGESSDELLARNLASVSRAHPGYIPDVERFARQHPLSAFHQRLRQCVTAQPASGRDSRVRVLHLLHHGGGTEKHARDLARIEDPDILSFVLTSDGRNLDVDEYHAGRRLGARRFPLTTAIGRYGPLHDAGYRDAITATCLTLGVDLLHVHHLMHHTLDIGAVADALGIPYVMTLHDYHTVCPMYTLLDPDGRSCGACLLGVDGRSVDACMGHAGQPAAYLDTYQTAMAGFLGGAARLFVPSVRAREIIAGRFPDAMARATVIEHGHATLSRTEAIEPLRATSCDGRALAVAVIGGLEVHKGAAVFRDLLRANRRGETTFHLYGTTPDAEIAEGPRHERRILDGSHFVYHGAYESADIVRMLIADGIDVGLQPAIWPETFSYTLSEFVEAGVPVIAGALGAQGERIERHRLGWTVPDIRDPRATLAILDAIGKDRERLAEVRRGMRRAEALTPLESIWPAYAQTYRDLAAAKTDRSVPPIGAVIGADYLGVLAAALADARRSQEPDERRLAESESALAALRSRLQSPRHRIAESIGDAIQRIPVIWPLLKWATEAFQRREKRRRTP